MANADNPCLIPPLVLDLPINEFLGWCCSLGFPSNKTAETPDAGKPPEKTGPNTPQRRAIPPWRRQIGHRDHLLSDLGPLTSPLASAAMRRQDKADRIGEILDHLYPETPVPLDHRDPYTLLVAVMLSAQTTDKKVNQVTPHLFAVADTPAKMAALDPEQIRVIIREIGLAPTKAKNLHLMAHQILDAGGEVIADWDFLESLAGVGHKTAGVVLSQAFGIPAFPVDTHIHRLAARWGLSDGTTVEHTERDLKKVFAIETWNARHLQIIFFGREYCPALYHDLTACPICSWASTKKRQLAEAPKRGRVTQRR